MPIKPDGNFVSEAYRDGRTYFFEAFYSARQWSAEIWDTDGRIRGAITCLPLADRLETDGLEDAVCDWVHRAIAHEVGITVGLQGQRNRHERPALRQVAPAGGADGHASANAAMFHLPRSATPEEIRGAALRQESALLVARFREVAEQWNVRWDRPPQRRKLSVPA